MYEITKKGRVYKPDLIYPELSYQIVGVLFDIFLQLGYGYRESQYQKVTEVAFKSAGLNFKRELPIKIYYRNKFIATNYLDFLIDEKVVLEIKQGNVFNKHDIEQLYNYLRVTGLKLGILARFTRSGVKYKRIVNTH
jgi:GxxExxY protein